MARRTVTIPIEDYFGYVDQRYPNTIYPVEANGEYKVTGTQTSTYSDKKERTFYFKIGTLPDALKYQRLYDVQYVLCMYYSPPSDHEKEGRAAGAIGVQEYDTRTLTYNTKPAYASGSTATATATYATITAAGGQNAWADVTSELYNSGGNFPKQASKNAKSFLTARYFRLDSGGFELPNSVYSMYVAVKPRLLGGGMPYIIITYDDAETVTGKVELVDKLTGQIDQGIDHTVTWEIKEKLDSETDWFCNATTWDQTSAVFYWREQGASTWNQIEIEDDTKAVTIPARTFASDKTYQYYVEATDTAGGTSETATFTFTTPGSQIVAQNSPTSGYANPRDPITFSWAYSSGTGTVAGGATVLHYRVAGAQSWTDVSASAGTYSITIPANTFSILSNYEWYLSGEDTYEYESQTEVYTFSTSAAQITAIPLAPINTIEDKNDVIHFAWEFVSNDSAPSSKCILQYKLATSSTWIQLIQLGSNVTSYDVPANTFDAGAIEWRVIPYNIDEVEGETSIVSFISFGAPVPPTVFTDNAPFLSIMWQAEEQESFQIMVDDESYGPYFGTDKKFTVPDYLADGQHTVKIRTMGVYGLWGKWGETTATIQNQAGEDITLTASSGVDITLSWETEEETADFRIYRDGVQIARTTSNSFADRKTLGQHTYKVINKLADGNYSESEEVIGLALVDNPIIALLQGGNWIEIKYRNASQRDPQFEESTEVAYNHLAGNLYPTAFTSGYRESNLTYSVVFLVNQTEEHAEFRTFFGQPVIIKLPDNSIHTGILNSWSRLVKKNYYTSYAFTIRQAEVEDFIDDTQ